MHLLWKALALKWDWFTVNSKTGAIQKSFEMARKVPASNKQHIVRGHCIDCKHSDLMQWSDDPIIAKCKVTGIREVAKSKSCERYERAVAPKDIQHLKKHYGLL